jgi:inosine triphosphate pyrophosphatase
MTTTYFITGNKNKFKEAKAILPDIEQLDIDLPEIQAIDAQVVIKAKLEAAFEHRRGNFIVEDTSLYLDCLNGLPGPLIKWFMKTIGNDGLHELAAKFGNYKVQAKTVIGYAKNKDEIYFFEGVVNGSITAPAHGSDFGWDPIFKPDQSDKTYAYMSPTDKNAISVRRIALNKLKDYLKAQRGIDDF